MQMLTIFMIRFFNQMALETTALVILALRTVCAHNLISFIIRKKIHFIVLGFLQTYWPNLFFELESCNGSMPTNRVVYDALVELINFLKIRERASQQEQSFPIFWLVFFI